MYVVTGEEMHRIDRFTMDEIGLSDHTLMENAGQAVARQLEKMFDQNAHFLVLIGAGNNGGDGFVISRYLQEKGYPVETWVIPPASRIKGTAAHHKHIYEQCGYSFKAYETNNQSFREALATKGIIIDALLGTGVTGKLRSPYDHIIRLVNESGNRIVSVDIPSGLPDSEGGNYTEVIWADDTITLQSLKLTACLYPEGGYYGKVTCVDIGIPNRAFSEQRVTRRLILQERVKATLATRDVNTHKGGAGKALVIGGSSAMTGAPTMTAQSCLRSGAGLVTMAVPESIHDVVTQHIMESMFASLSDAQGEITNESLKQINYTEYDGIALGPGMGRKHRLTLYERFKDVPGYLVIDADGLYHLHDDLSSWRGGHRLGPTIITPHSGEMARLTGCSVKEVEAHRFTLSKAFAKDYNMYVILKGPYTIVTTPSGDQWVNTSGNASLAKGGTGDTLTGIILGLLLQHKNIEDALCNAVYVHGKAADHLLDTHDMFSVNATDLISVLPRVLKLLRY
ncbi:NAD(P)H-hydrate dehydratase [Salipaludibacillus sp. LMS25]|jgi:NAD(P)H-hydrate epimerase|uniref:NAD(P)H-hydrate dehydratase n=1 Tax=Salipaludibacillus sp. LMS25 TaxID=2924031 RepID=UPI0020D0921A|nr:NAD(P)H-hydrate dehydratase [Salipaludibacillus sp. LMS25]UTR13405.1 NAD(P)H-hydrate dehydratase [Salipaludibacillus sp. LMS25]